MEYVLARQIDYQHYLLHREARRHERRMRRAKRDDKVQAMEAGVGPATVQPVQVVKKERKRRSATSAPPPQANAVKPERHSGKTRDQKRDKSKVDEKKKRRSRSSVPQVQIQADPTGKVRQWILQQSDFMPQANGKNEKS